MAYSTRCLLFATVSILGVSTAYGFGGGGGPIDTQMDTPTPQIQIPASLSNGRASRYMTAPNGLSSAPLSIDVVPMGGSLWRDVFVNNYVDLDPGKGLLDWDCTDRTYDGHDGYDINLRTFGEQDIGVPVFAAQDGTVLSTHDGEYDRNTRLSGQPANYVVIRHGANMICYYYHMKKNSVSVAAGDQVVAGQQIGLVGSSGNSTAPHLHFATYVDGKAVEPSAGVCHAARSLWRQQPPIMKDTYIWDFGISHELLTGHSYPDSFPRSSHISLDDPWIAAWMLVNNLPAGSTHRIILIDPQGMKQVDLPLDFGGNGYYRWSWWWYWVWNPATNATVGTWRYVWYVNDKKMIDVPFEVHRTRSSSFNRPPNPIALSFEPALPTGTDVVVCRVETDLVLDDPDWDIVRYEYVWRIGDQVVRQVVSAAQSDALPRGLVATGDTLVCTVTPSDGRIDGPTSEISAVVGRTGTPPR